jgi:hypothetical protein
MRRQKLEELVWDNLDTAGGDSRRCWEWRGSKRNGYGCITVDGKTQAAHRVVYELLVEPIPEGMFVCHKCDNPPCCNPAHLFLGTAKDNCHDMIDKGRQGWPAERYDIDKPTPPRELTEDEKETAVTLWKAGYQIDDIAESSGLPARSVRRAIRDRPLTMA